MKVDLPVMQCIPGCTDCCGPIVVTDREYERVRRYADENGVTPRRQGVESCCFAQDGRCAVYPVRPLICRIFGHGSDQRLTCPHGCNVNVKPRQIQKLIDRQVRKEGVADRWLNEMVYSEAEMQEALAML